MGLAQGCVQLRNFRIVLQQQVSDHDDILPYSESSLRMVPSR